MVPSHHRLGSFQYVSLTVLDTDQKSWIVPKSYSEVCIESMDPDKYFHQSRPNCILVLVSRVLSRYRKDDTSPKGKESQGTTSWKLGWLTDSAVANSGWYYKTFTISRVRVLLAWYRVTIDWVTSSRYLLLDWVRKISRFSIF